MSLDSAQPIDTFHYLDEASGKARLEWPIQDALTYYSVEPESGDPARWQHAVNFIRRFLYAGEAASKLRARHGGTWVVRQWAYDPETDISIYVGIAGRFR